MRVQALAVEISFLVREICLKFQFSFSHEQMIIKGRDHERVKAWALAKAIIQDNEMQAFKVDQSLHGRLIGAKGVLKKMMELESGAHIVYRVEPEPCCQIYGNQGARERAWQLVSGMGLVYVAALLVLLTCC